MLSDNQTFQVEGRALLSLNGWALKAYILLRNSEEALTCAEIAQALQTERNAVWYALQRELVERRFVQKTDNKYQVFKFPFTPLNEKFTALNDCSKIDKEQERSKEKEKKNSSSSAREKIFSWLTKNEETMRVLCMREKITVEDAQSEDSLREALEPYIEEFWRGLIAEGGDLYQLDPFDTRRHFSNWLRKYRRKEEMVHTPSACGHLSKEFYESHRLSIAAPDLLAKGDRRLLHPYYRGRVSRELTEEQIDEQMLMKRRREEQAAELQRKYDEQQAEAEAADDARAAFFAKRLNYQKERRNDENTPKLLS